ncbi:MAG: phosphoglucomutase (alpha-D-glucose-1,6-bisphosphate-dependent) [Desulfovibrionaceae bacterium]
MAVHPEAGTLSAPENLVSIPSLIASYYTDFPDPTQEAQRIAFGTSGHRGGSEKTTFNEEHIYAVTQAVCDVRKAQGTNGPLFLGVDTHALSEPAYRSALEVLVANGVQVCIAPDNVFTPTPAVSHAILCYNRGRTGGYADGIIITPSHNPPTDGGFKYNPPHGGPAESKLTTCIEERANDLLMHDNKDVQLMQYRRARASHLVREHDYIRAYVDDLAQVLDMDAIAQSGLRLGVDPLGGASLHFWEPIAEKYKLHLTLVNREADPTFRFVPRDHDGKIRMDCSSPYAMSALLRLRNDFDLACACDPDSDRHGIVSPEGLMNPNQYLSVAAWYLFQHRPQWSAQAGIGKTLVTSSMLDRVGASLGRKVVEVPVGFKWFVPYLVNGTCGMGCEESAGASFLRKNGEPWSTDKDGLLLCLLAAEITAKKGKNPAELYTQLTQSFGAPVYARIDSAADPHTRHVLLHLNANQVTLKHLAGGPVQHILTHAPGNNAPIGGVKVCSADGWFAIRPSGTEDICKIYAESFKGPEHLAKIQEEAKHLLQSLVG